MHLPKQIREDDKGGLGETKMATKNEIAEVDHDATPETRVWQAVILQTVQEWINGPARLSAQAEQYLFSDNTDFPMVCLSAGMDVQRLRTSLARIRSRVAKPQRAAEVRPLVPVADLAQDLAENLAAVA
jgi:hypothetical protein